MCSQAVFAAFSPNLGLDKEQDLKIGACFGSGMRKGEVYGACTGVLMALGLKYGESNKKEKLFKIGFQITNKNGSCSQIRCSSRIIMVFKQIIIKLFKFICKIVFIF